MDFVRLAVRDVRKNGSRTALAIAATALATAILVLSRIVPQGYMKYLVYAERSFADADILVLRAPQHVYSQDASPLEWRPWAGEEWQSYAEYFMPGLKESGYVAPAGAPPWGPLDSALLSSLISTVEGVQEVSPYLSFPCKVDTGDSYADAILRGRAFGGPAEPLAMDWMVKRGRALGPEDEGRPAALVPQVSTPVIPFSAGMRMEILLPRSSGAAGGAGGPHGEPALRWDDPVAVDLDVVGLYKVELGAVPLEHLGEQEPTGIWGRPEILVSRTTFLDLVREVAPEPPVYQMLVKVARHSETKAVVQRLRETLGPDYGVYAIAELVVSGGNMGGVSLIVPDMSRLVRWMIITMAAGIVAGSVYILLALQTPKIGLLRAIGATSRDIMVYALSAVAYTTLFGIGIGFALGKVITLTVITATGFSLLEWLKMAGYDALLSLSGMVIPLVFGLGVAIRASRIPCAEVLRRE